MGRELRVLNQGMGRELRVLINMMQDTAVDLDRLIPPFKGASGVELGYLAGQTLLPIDVEGDRQYFVSIPHGCIMQKDLLLKVLRGELDGKT